MTNDEFIDYRNKLDDYCIALLQRKKDEYTGDEDRLSNFTKAGQLLGLTPISSLIGFMAKQEVSLHDMCIDIEDGKTFPLIQWREKIGDIRNYLDLLWAMVCEIEDENEEGEINYQ